MKKALIAILAVLVLMAAVISIVSGDVGPEISLCVLGGLIPNLNLGGLLPKKQPSGLQHPYPDHLVITDGDAAYDTMAKVLAIIGALAAGSVPTLVWERTVEAQAQYRWGFGSPLTPHNQGYMWFASMLEGTGFETGKLRLLEARAKNMQTWVVKILDDTRLHTATMTTLITATPKSINEMIALPEQVNFPIVGEDSLLQLEYACISVPGVEDAVGFSIPVTIRQ